MQLHRNTQNWFDSPSEGKEVKVKMDKGSTRWFRLGD